MQEQQKKIYMWHKIRELSAKDMNKSQISRELSIDRSTVSKYLTMSEDEFYDWISDLRRVPLKLAPYLNFVKKELEDFPGYSAAQIEDHLKEHFSDFPPIHSKTVYNFVERVRKKHNLPKPKSTVREFEQLPESPYGKRAQVDFGESWLQTNNEKRLKIYFFSIVLSRSRHKFFYCQDKPFTAATAVYAHQLAFDYFEGIPAEIVYDQDSVFITDENLGDYRLTSDFERFNKTQGYKAIFCRKADPQSKGKVENVVKYIKQNFLRGRKYIDIDTLNQSALDWLHRTGNGKQHAATRKIPHQEWLVERTHLQPVKSKAQKPESVATLYKVRKDNTVLYRSNYYSLPLGTYKDRNTQIQLRVKDAELEMYCLENKLIAKHQIYVGQGKLIKNNDHSRDKSKSLDKLHQEVILILGNNAQASDFLTKIKQDKARYYRDNLQYIKHKFVNHNAENTIKALGFCISNKLFNAARFCEINDGFFTESQKEIAAEKAVLPQNATPANAIAVSSINTSNIDDYQTIFEKCNN